MKRSTERILVTHAGSLARPKDLMEMLLARNDGKPYDREALPERLCSAVAEVAQKQIECGVDIVNDGELGKSNFSRYARERLSGFVERPAGPDFKPTSIFGRDMIEFPDYFNRGGRTSIGHHSRVFYCAEPLKYVGHDEVKADIENLKAQGYCERRLSSANRRSRPRGRLADVPSNERRGLPEVPGDAHRRAQPWIARSTHRSRALSHVLG